MSLFSWDAMLLCAALQKDKFHMYNEDDVIFFERQLDLYGKLSYVSIV